MVPQPVDSLYAWWLGYYDSNYANQICQIHYCAASCQAADKCKWWEAIQYTVISDHEIHFPGIHKI